MFAETLLESGAGRRPGRGWATTASFSLQIAVVAVLVVLPSLYPEIMALHRATPVSVPIFSQAPQEQAPPVGQQSGSSTIATTHVINVANPTLRFGRKREGEIGPIGPPNLNLAHGDGLPTGLDIGMQPPVLKPPVPREPVRLSRMDPGSLIHSVQPAYPPIAKSAGIQGQVTLTAIISKTGEIESLHVSSGHPMLVRAAQEAVSRWRYRPYILNGEPIEVETQITVNFRLNN